MLRMLTLNSDRTPVHEATRVVQALHPNTAKPLEDVTVTLRLVSDDTYKSIQREHREMLKDEKTGTVDWKIDNEGIVRDVVKRAVIEWTGIVGADNRPVPVCGAAIEALDWTNLNHLCSMARTRTDLIDAGVVAESFREPAAVGAVAH